MAAGEAKMPENFMVTSSSKRSQDLEGGTAESTTRADERGKTGRLYT